jgi:hypothetical protein
MEKEEYLELMFETYRDWLENKSFDLEVAAFEYLKRNPYFLEVTLDFVESYFLEKDIFQKERLLISFREKMKKSFLYTGVDVELILGIHENNDELKLAKFINFDMLCLQLSDTNQREEFLESERNKLLRGEKSTLIPASDFKKDNIFNLDEIVDDLSSQRWIEELQPSMYIKINPYQSNTRLKSNIDKAMKFIKNSSVVDVPLNDTDVEYNSKDGIDNKWNRYSRYATPDYMIENNGHFISDYKAKSFHSYTSAMSLIMYDLSYVFKKESAVEIEKLLADKLGDELFYGTTTKNSKEDDTKTPKDSFDKYFQYTSFDRDLSFNSKMIKDSMKEVTKRINFDYLKYIYPSEAIMSFFENEVKEEITVMSLSTEEYKIKINELLKDKSNQNKIIELIQI